MTAIPQIVKSAEGLLLEVEKAVAAFPRKYRYLIGADLREDATNAVLLGQEAGRAARDKRRQISLLRELSRTIDRIKLKILLGHRLQCYSFDRCRHLSILAADCGKQCGGWLSSTLKGQSPAASWQRERASVLSTPAASPEA